MTEHLQLVVVALVVTLATIFVGRYAWAQWRAGSARQKSKAACGACGSCPVARKPG